MTNKYRQEILSHSPKQGDANEQESVSKECRSGGCRIISGGRKRFAWVYGGIQILVSGAKKAARQMAKDIVSLQKHADSTENSIAAVEMKAKNLIDKSLSSQSTTDTSWKDEVSVLAGELVARVEGFERRMDDLEHKLTRYFDKEKYAITKGIITQIINEEKANG